MKHPALARVFAVVVAIFSLFLLFSGIRGFGKTGEEYADRLAYEEKFSGRIENYEKLHEELLNSADYTETMQALRRFVDEHERAAAQHKTDTALFSATKGGLKMGEDMIVAIRAQMDELRQQMRDATSRRAFLEGLLTELIASQKSNMPWLDALANQAAQYAVDSYTQGTSVALVAGELRALMENEPTPQSVSAVPFTPPEPPVEMTLPMVPELFGMSFEVMQDVYQQTSQNYLDAAAAYEQAAQAYMQEMQDYYNASAQQAMDQLTGGGPGAADALNSAALSAEYKLAHSLWEDECKTVKQQLDIHEARTWIHQLSSALSSLVKQGNSASASLTMETGGIYPAAAELTALADSTCVKIDARIDTDLASLSNEEFLLFADEIEGVFDMITDAFIVVAQNLDNPASLIAELMDKLHVTEALVKVLDQMLEKADHEIQAQLEELWYQMGETEKDTIKLEAQKLGLDKEAVLLSKRTLDAEALKDLRSRHVSARQLLINVPEVRAATSDDSELADNARAWLAGYAGETEKLYKGRLLINILAVLSGVMGVLGIPAAYELIRKRFMLIAPVLLCTLCAAGAEALNMALGLGQHYVALFTAIFALLQLLIVLPRARKKRHTPQHLKA